jgi:tetratricopeptide (TPR) repeat protein
MRFVLIFPLLLACSVWLGGRDHNQGAKQKEATVIIFRSADGRTLTMEDLRGVTGTFRWEVVGRMDVPAEAELLHEQGRQAGRVGDYNKALSLLERSSNLARGWPYPVYDMAYTFLLTKDADNARKYYRKTVELAPRGFFTAITALDTLEREQKGDLPAGTYLAYLSLEWLDDPGKKAKLVRRMVTQVPRFAPAWKDLANTLDGDVERLAAIEKGLAAEPDPETKGTLLINKALVLNRAGDHRGAIKLLGELALDPESTYGTEHLAKASLAIVAQKTQ